MKKESTSDQKKQMLEEHGGSKKEVMKYGAAATRNRKGPVGRPDRPIVALYERRENRAGNWLLSKRGHVTCDPHRMPLTMGERANLQGSYAYTTRGGTVRFAEHKIEKSPGKRIDAMRWSRKMFLTRQLPRYPFTGP